MADNENPNYNFLTKSLELLEGGKSIYGDPASPAARAQIEEFKARLDLGRELGEFPPAPPPIMDRLRQERLNDEHPGGDPATQLISEDFSDIVEAQLDGLSELSGLALARQTDEVANDLVDRPTPDIFAFVQHDPSLGRRPTPREVVERMVEASRPAVDLWVEPEHRAETLRLLPGNRHLLSLLAVQGQKITAYNRDKIRFRVK